MHKRRIIAAVALAGAVAAGGSAFTAASGIDDDAKIVGATAQGISGIQVSDVSYDWTSATDRTNSVTFTVNQVLDTTDVLTVTLDGTGSTCSADIETSLVYTCTFAGGVVDGKNLSIVVN